MKRWMERGYDPSEGERDEIPKGPLWVEPVEPGRSRSRYALPILAAAFVVGAFVIAMVTHYVDYFGGAAATPTPTPTPRPIAWVDTTVPPTATPEPTPDASAGSTAEASAAASGVPSGPTPSPSKLISIRAEVTSFSAFWPRGVPHHFTIELTNTSSRPISMNPCPTYRMYIAGTDTSAAPLRWLNCEAIGGQLVPGQGVALDMVYTPTVRDPLGAQTLYWELWPEGRLQARAGASVFIQQ